MMFRALPLPVAPESVSVVAAVLPVAAPELNAVLFAVLPLAGPESNAVLFAVFPLAAPVVVEADPFALCVVMPPLTTYVSVPLITPSDDHCTVCV